MKDHIVKVLREQFKDDNFVLDLLDQLSCRDSEIAELKQWKTEAEAKLIQVATACGILSNERDEAVKLIERARNHIAEVTHEDQERLLVELTAFLSKTAKP